MPGIGKVENDGYERQGIICDYTRKWCNMKDETCPLFCTKHRTCDCMCIPGDEDYPEVEK